MKRYKKKWIFILVLLVPFFGYYFLQKTEQLITESFKSKVVLLNDNSLYKLSYSELEVSLLKQSFLLKDVFIRLDSTAVTNGKNQPHIYINSFLVNDFEPTALVLNKRLNIGQLILDSLEITYQIEKKSLPPKKAPSANRKDNPLKRLSIDNVVINNYLITGFTSKSEHTTTVIEGKKLSISNVILEKPLNKKQLHLQPLQLQIAGDTIHGKLGKTALKLPQFEFDFQKQYAQLKGLEIGNIDSLKQEAAKKKHNSPANHILLPTLNCFGIQTDTLLQKGAFIADSMVIKNASFTVLKNTEKPWNTNKSLPLPHQIFRRTKPKIGLKSLTVQNATLDYSELHKEKGLSIPIDHIELAIENLGWTNNLGDTKEENSLKIKMQGRLFNDFLFKLNLDHRNPMNQDEFKFRGSIESFNFETFNPIMVPTSNIKFESGRVRNISFNGTGDLNETSGEFVMLYSNLNATVLKNNNQQENKTFSWLANAAVRKENPKKGKIKVAKMGYKRVPYKGFGNYMFKTIESGLINSVYPFGKRKEYK